MNVVAVNHREDRSMPTRRSFIRNSLGAGALLATQGARRAAAQADRRMIVDAQIHLWKAESEDWKWVPGLKPQLPEPFTIERAIGGWVRRWHRYHPLPEELGVRL